MSNKIKTKSVEHCPDHHSIDCVLIDSYSKYDPLTDSYYTVSEFPNYLCEKSGGEIQPYYETIETNTGV